MSANLLAEGSLSLEATPATSLDPSKLRRPSGGFLRGIEKLQGAAER